MYTSDIVILYCIGTVKLLFNILEVPLKKKKKSISMKIWLKEMYDLYNNNNIVLKYNNNVYTE